MVTAITTRKIIILMVATVAMVALFPAGELDPIPLSIVRLHLSSEAWWYDTSERSVV
jgi:hypothetical protein